MAVRPYPKVLTGTAPDIINAIRNSATQNFKNHVPIATPDAESVKAIGAIIMDHVSLQNEFLDALVNRIATVRITSKMYENPIAMFKKGFLEFGETVEEAFVDLVKVQQFDPETAESELYKREIPDVKSAFHVMNFQKLYKVSISRQMLEQAFLSWDGVEDLSNKIIEQVYTSANYDEFLTMKYMIAKRILNGQIAVKTWSSASAEPMKALAKSIKTVSNNLEFMSPNYNIAGVRTHALKDKQFLLITAEADAEMDVDALASAFNMDKIQFLGHRVLIDGFDKLDMARLNELFEGDLNYVPFTNAELSALAEVPAILIDNDWFMIYDNLALFDEVKNGQGLYWNYMYHVWKTFSTSPFANGIMFLPDNEKGEVTGITITNGGQATHNNNHQKIRYLNVEVSTTGIGANKSVIWSVDEETIPEGVTVKYGQNGVFTLDREDSATPFTGLTYIATSVDNPEIYGEYVES